jgi:hypothetical protein
LSEIGLAHTQKDRSMIAIRLAFINLPPEKICGINSARRGVVDIRSISFRNRRSNTRTSWDSERCRRSDLGTRWGHRCVFIAARPPSARFFSTAAINVLLRGAVLRRNRRKFHGRRVIGKLPIYRIGLDNVAHTLGRRTRCCPKWATGHLKFRSLRFLKGFPERVCARNFPGVVPSPAKYGEGATKKKNENYGRR